MSNNDFFEVWHRNLTKKELRDDLQKKLQAAIDEIVDVKLPAVIEDESDETWYLTGRLDGLMVAFYLVCGIDTEHPFPDFSEDPND